LSLADDETEEDIEERCINAINVFEPRAEALNITAIAKPDRNSVQVIVEFRIINTEETVTNNYYACEAKITWQQQLIQPH